MKKWPVVQVECWNYRKDCKSNRRIVDLNADSCKSDCEAEECPLYRDCHEGKVKQ